MKKYKYFLFNCMDGIVFVSEIYFWDLYDFCFLGGEGEFNEYYIKIVVDKRDGLL